MVVLKKCCCCCRLDTGSVILGYIESFLSLILLILGIVLVAKAEYIAKMFNDLLREGEKQKGVKFDESMYLSEKSLKIDGSIFIVITAVSLLVSIALIIGATKRNHKLVLPFLGVKLIYFIYLLYGFIAVMIKGSGPQTAVQFAIYLGFGIYLWLCVFSLYQEIREHPNSPRDAYIMQQQPYNPQVYKPPSMPN